jgi:cbb3-type cytochrome oxidase maturation protein
VSILLFLIPLGLGLVAIALWAFIWAVNHDQFDDLDRAAHSILFDDDLQPGVDPVKSALGEATQRDADPAARRPVDERSR